MFKRKFLLALILLLGFGLFIFMLGLKVGPAQLNWSDFLHLTPLQKNIIFSIRFPRLINAFFIGAALASAGACFQGVLKNPLADPYILGVSAGAGLGASIAILLNLELARMSWLVMFALIGAMVSILLVELIVRQTKSAQITNFILAGIIINAFFSAITLLFLFLAQQKMQNILFWLMGDCSKTALNTTLILGLIALPFWLILFFFSQQLNIISVGDNTALALGIKVTTVRRILLYSASILTSLAVASGGIIGFIGLVVPHLLRLIWKDDFRILLPFALLFGGIFLMGADILARVLLPFTELPVGVLTSFIGAPFFWWLLVKQTK